MLLYGIIILIVILIIRVKLIEKFENKETNAMIIVEPRRHALLKSVIEKFDEIMDASWDLYVFHGISNEDYAKEATKNINKRKVYLYRLDTDNLTPQHYSYLFKQSYFWNVINAENILVFQSDSILCKQSLNNIYNFVKYDYIGCANSKDDYGEAHGFNGWGIGNPFYGIGGLSFRKKSFINKCIQTNKVDNYYPEDVYFSECLNKFGNKPESAKILNTFCSQNHYQENSFGAHRIKNMDNKGTFLEYCLDADLIKDEGFKNFKYY
jgi:hypothetical protein